MPSPNEILSYITYIYEAWMEQPQLSLGELLSTIAEEDRQQTAVDVRTILTAAVHRLDYPRAELSQDYCGVEYWEEGYRFDENQDGLRLTYVAGTDVSPEAVDRCLYRQYVCDHLMNQVIHATR